MWPWQRARPEAHHASGEAAARSAAHHPEWPALPPIQRTVGVLRPVAPREEFAASLMSWRDPSFLAPLGHLVSDEAPSGVIHRLIEPAGVPEDHPAGPPLSFAARAPQSARSGGVVQRMFARFSERDPDPEPMPADEGQAGASAPEPPPPQVVPMSQPAPAVLTQRAASAAAPLTEAPPLTLPVLELAALPAELVEPELVEPAGSEPPVREIPESKEEPTLGVGSPSSAPVASGADDGGSGSAEAPGHEGHAAIPLPATPGRPAPLRIARTAAAPPMPVTAPVDPVQRELGRATSGTAAGAGAASQAAAGHEARQPAESAPTAPLVGQSGSVSLQRDGDPAAGPSDDSPAASSMTLPTAPSVPHPEGSPVRYPAGPDRSRRLGLGPPLNPDALTLQRSPAAQVPPPAPPPAVAQRLDPVRQPALPSPSQRPPAITQEAAPPNSTPSDDEPISPLVGRSALPTTPPVLPPLDHEHPATEASPLSATTPPIDRPVVQRSADPGQAAVDGDGAPRLAPPNTLLDEPLAVAPPPGDSPAPPAGVPPAPAPAMPVPWIAALEPGPRAPDSSDAPPPSLPVVARLVGDRTPPLLAAPVVAGSPGTSFPGSPGIQAPVQRLDTQPKMASGRVDQQLGGAVNGSAWLAAPIEGNVQRAAGHGQRAAGAPALHTTPVVPALPAQAAPPVVPAVVPAEPVPPTVQTVPVVQSVPVVQTVSAESEPESQVDSSADAEPGPGPQPSQGAPTPAGSAPSDPDELAKKLFDPLLRRIKAELRLDRERRGVLTDLRH